MKPAVGNTDSSLQYDTVDGLSTPKDDYFGYTFAVFQEGKHFTHGGWFKKLSAKSPGKESGKLDGRAAAVTPAYPNGNTQAAFGQSFETYTFTLNAPTTGDGFRIFGTAGGTNYFSSSAELEAWGY